MTKCTSLSYQFYMESSVTGLNNFQAFIQFAPTSNQAANSGVINLVNSPNPTSLVLGTLAGEQSAWPALYGKTKIHKIVMKYIPAQTCGMAGQTPGATVTAATINFSQSAVMYTVPVYDNVDDVIDDTGKIVTGTDVQSYLIKPYCKAHSIYKPWTRVLTPKQYMTYTSYNGAQCFKKMGGYFDLDNVGTLLNGLWIGMEPITQGGLVPNNVQVDQSFPPINTVFVLGEIQLTIYQSFKTRT